MGLLKGMLTAARFRVDGDLPTDWRERYRDGLLDQAFREPVVRTKGEETEGWVEIHNLLDSDFANHNRWLYHPWALFSLRVDKKRLPANLVRATLEKRCQAWCEERETTSCPAAVRSELKSALEEEWFARMLPTVQVTDVGWNVADKTVLVGSLAEGTLARVRKRFFQTFGLRLVPWSPLDILDDKQQVDALLGSSPEAWGPLSEQGDWS